MAKISQREARRIKKQLEQLRVQVAKQRNTYGQEYHGVNICTLNNTDADSIIPQSVRVARRLGHVVVVVGDDTGNLRFMALPHPKEPVE